MWNFWVEHLQYFSTDVFKSLILKLSKCVDYFLMNKDFTSLERTVSVTACSWKCACFSFLSFVILLDHRQPKLSVRGKISNDIFKILSDFVWKILIFAFDRKESIRLKNNLEINIHWSLKVIWYCFFPPENGFWVQASSLYVTTINK